MSTRSKKSAQRRESLSNLRGEKESSSKKVEERESSSKKLRKSLHNEFGSTSKRASLERAPPQKNDNKAVRKKGDDDSLYVPDKLLSDPKRRVSKKEDMGLRSITKKKFCDDSDSDNDSVTTSASSSSFGTDIVYAVGSRCEARDFTGKWYPCKIIDLDWKDHKMKIHFEYWSQKYDQWMPIDSQDLRPLRPSTGRGRRDGKHGKAFKNGDKVYARWSDGRKYPAKIMKKQTDDLVRVRFFDGFEKEVSAKTLELMHPSEANKVEFSNTPILVPERTHLGPIPDDSLKKVPEKPKEGERRKRTLTDKASEFFAQKRTKLSREDTPVRTSTRETPRTRSNPRKSSEGRGSTSNQPLIDSDVPTQPADLATVDIVIDADKKENIKMTILYDEEGRNTSKKDTVIAEPSEARKASKRPLKDTVVAEPSEARKASKRPLKDTVMSEPSETRNASSKRPLKDIVIAEPSEDPSVISLVVETCPEPVVDTVSTSKGKGKLQAKKKGKVEEEEEAEMDEDEVTVILPDESSPRHSSVKDSSKQPLVIVKSLPAYKEPSGGNQAEPTKRSARIRSKSEEQEGKQVPVKQKPDHGKPAATTSKKQMEPQDGIIYLDNITSKKKVYEWNVADREFLIKEDHHEFKCPKEGCGKGFRKEGLLQMHIKHYHPEYTKYVSKAPKVMQLAARLSLREEPSSTSPPEVKPSYIKKIAQLEAKKIKKEATPSTPTPPSSKTSAKSSKEISSPVQVSPVPETKSVKPETPHVKTSKQEPHAIKETDVEATSTPPSASSKAEKKREKDRKNKEVLEADEVVVSTPSSKTEKKQEKKNKEVPDTDAVTVSTPQSSKKEKNKDNKSKEVLEIDVEATSTPPPPSSKTEKKKERDRKNKEVQDTLEDVLQSFKTSEKDGEVEEEAKDEEEEQDSPIKEPVSILSLDVKPSENKPVRPQVHNKPEKSIAAFIQDEIRKEAEWRSQKERQKEEKIKMEEAEVKKEETQKDEAEKPKEEKADKPKEEKPKVEKPDKIKIEKPEKVKIEKPEKMKMGKIRKSKRLRSSSQGDDEEWSRRSRDTDRKRKRNVTESSEEEVNVVDPLTKSTKRKEDSHSQKKLRLDSASTDGSRRDLEEGQDVQTDDAEQGWEDNIILCSCGSNEDEGLMIQCELCLTWQHGACHDIDTNEQVPEKYICSKCTHPELQRESARYLHLQEWITEGKLARFEFIEGNETPKNLETVMKKSHELCSNLLNLKKVVRSLRHKLNIASEEGNPKVVHWAKPWESTCSVPHPLEAGLPIADLPFATAEDLDEIMENDLIHHLPGELPQNGDKTVPEVASEVDLKVELADTLQTHPEGSSEPMKLDPEPSTSEAQQTPMALDKDLAKESFSEPMPTEPLSNVKEEDLKKIKGEELVVGEVLDVTGVTIKEEEPSTEGEGSQSKTKEEWGCGEILNESEAVGSVEEHMKQGVLMDDIPFDVGDLLRAGESLELPTTSSAPQPIVPPPQMDFPEPEKRIDFLDCRVNLLDHIESLQNQVDARLDMIDAQVAALEEADDMGIEPNSKTINVLLRDLATVRKIAALTTND